jgi:hypothetical protein
VDDRSVTDDIYAQRIDQEGNSAWTSNGLPVCQAAGTQSNIASVSDGTGGAIISWWDQRSGYKDEDGDGYSDGTQDTESYVRPEDYYTADELVAIAGDCDYSDSYEHPCQAWYSDLDDDGYSDCDDHDEESYPGNGCGKAMPWIQLLLTDD